MDKLVEFFIYMQGPGPYVVAFSVLVACGLGLPIPEDVILFSIGLLCYYGLADLKISIAVCLVGVLVGDSIIYWIGRHFGTRLIKKGFLAKIFPADRMVRAKEMFHRWGNKVILAARFMPGLRAPTYFSAGTLHLPFQVFVLYDGMAAAVSVPLFIGVVYYFGDHVDHVIKVVRKVQNGMAIALAVVITIFLLKHYFPKIKNLFVEKRKKRKKARAASHH